ncbi:uncharacterized protein [Dermacentor albipictus]|uniref:uncharacterized protein isoform X1 n=1 Tax=Dermacentor albipictus TaxID=60249 RepID=UPI0038FC0BEA
MKASAGVLFALQALCLLGEHGATQSRQYDDARIADELGRLFKLPQPLRYGGPNFHFEYPVLANNGVTLAGATYSLDDFSLPWRLVRHYAQMQLSTYKMATGNPAMRAAIARHNAARMMDLLNHVEMAGSRRAQFGHGSVQVVQESGLMSEVKLVSEVNVYLVASLVAALVILFTAYCSCVIAKHVSCLLKDTVPQPVAQERARLLLQAAE